MAYADKITTMRRMALIHPESIIVWEGVNIEGICVLKKTGIYGTEIITIKEEEIEALCGNDYEHPLICKYQDKADEEMWEPRESK